MKKDWKYITYLGILGALLLVLMLSKSKQYDWTITFHHEDKNPYGAYAFSQLFPTLINHSITSSYQPLYELKDTLTANENIFILSSTFSPDKLDTEVLLKHIENGGYAFISANNFYGRLADTLGITVSDSFFHGGSEFILADSTKIHFVNPAIDSAKQFYYKRGNAHNYFSYIDSVEASVISRNDFGQAVAVRINRGKGALILNCTPMAFTNIHLLDSVNHEFASASLSYLPQRETYWTEYYHVGRMEAATPLRFILRTEPLRWAYYLTIVSILMFMIFESKRKQRIIPIITPLANTTLEFVGTIGNLYYQRSDHKNIAEKKIQFFLEQVYSQFHINGKINTEEFSMLLTRKSGASEQTVRDLAKTINQITEKERISAPELTHLNELIEKFHQKK